MKNFTLLLATMLISISAIAAELNGGTTLYLNPGPWNIDGAVFVAYYWGDPNGDQWSDFSESTTSGIFQTTVPNGTWTGLKFVRMNPNGDKHNWNNKWDETGDLTYDGTNNQYTITGWGPSEGSWSSFNNGDNNGGTTPDPNPTSTIADGTKLYLHPSAEWKEANARFAAYFFGGDGELWLDMPDTNGDGIYEVTCQGTREKVIFCRMNPETTENNWDNKWNQTSDLTYDGVNNQYNVLGWDAGEWSVFSGNNGNEGNDNPEEPQPESSVYTLCGDPAIFGTEWEETDTNNDMTKGNDGVWVKEYIDVTLSNGTYEYKVVVNHNWETAGKYPADDTNMTLYIAKDGIYDITFTFNPTIPELKATAVNKVNVENVTINNIYAINGFVYADTDITIYTITGQNVTSQNGNLTNGVYIIKTQNATSKLIINN